MPHGIEKQELEKLEQLIETSSTLHVNDVLFRQGEPFSKLWAVKSGTFKSTRLDESGNEHVVGFHLPGELMGLDGIYPETYSTTVTALDSAVLCAMDYTELKALCVDIPALQNQLLRLLSRDIYESHRLNAETADFSAPQKLAGFLNNLSMRYEARGYSATTFKLAMSRQDIASHLGITPETVSRILKQFRQQALIDIDNRFVNIKRANELDTLISCSHR